MANKYLDKIGLSHLWTAIKERLGVIIQVTNDPSPNNQMYIPLDDVEEIEVLTMDDIPAPYDDTAIKSAVNSKYTKPVAGIPESDLSEDVQNKLNAEDAVTSVNGETGDVIISIPDKLSDLSNDVGYITEHQSLDEYVKDSDLAAVAKSGQYSDLQGAPTIPAEVTEDTVIGWGFTKNAGTYVKPSSGIPETDLSMDVQIKLNTGTGGGAVDSVNGKIGEVVLTAEDVGALPDTTIIPTVPTNVSEFNNDAGYITEQDIPEAVTEQDVSSWGFTKNKGDYSKPSTGIPETDLSQEVVDKLNTHPVSSVNGKTGQVTLNADDVRALPNTTIIPVVPENISSFQNDSKYVTENSFHAITDSEIDEIFNS